MRAAWITALALIAAAPLRAAEPVLQLHADTGWFDEIFALDGAGGRLAFVRADAVGALSLQVVDIAQHGAILATVPLTSSPIRIQFGRAGLFVVTHTDANNTSTAALYDEVGKLRARFAAANDFTYVTQDGREWIVAYDRRSTVEEEVAITDAAKPNRPLLRRTVVRGPSGMLAGLDFTPRTWQAGYLRLAGRSAGRYDPARNVRMPESDAVYDVLSGRILHNAAEADPIARARLTDLRAAHPNQDSFIFLRDEGSALVALTAADELVPLELGAPLDRYRLATLRVVPGPRGQLLFGLVAVSADATERQRRGRAADLLELFRFDPMHGAQVTRLFALPSDGRELIWQAAAGRVAVLRRHRSFGYGGPKLEVYDYH